MSQKNGIPAQYTKEYKDYFIEGFDIDSVGSYYFLCGQKATLVKIGRDKSPLFRKTYDQFSPNSMTVQKGKIFIFDNTYNHNTLTVLNSQNGDIIKQYPKLLLNVVNSCFYDDSAIILEVFNAEKPITMNTNVAYLKYRMNGEFIEEVKDKYGVPLSIFSEQAVNMVGYIVGQVNDTLVFKKSDDEIGNCTFWIGDTSGKIFQKAVITGKIFGTFLPEGEQEHFKVRNRNIYVLSRKEKNVCITIIPIDQLFSNLKEKK